jgi:NAD(P)-dependent dehydrogenase (short-subunit alcohol dehydrogenase family)
MDFLSLSNKKVFIVGGSGLIGSQLCNDFYKFGAEVIILDKKRNKNYKFFNINLEKTDSLIKQIKLAIHLYGCPDIFVNASYPKTSDWSYLYFNSNYKVESIIKNINDHLASYIILSLEIAEAMKKNKIIGSIINISSIYGLVAQDLSIYKNTSIKENMIYSAIKSGINGIGKQICSAYGQYGIRSNVICPGGIESKKLKKEKIFIKNYLIRNPIKRMCKSEDVSNLVLFLSSNSSNYISGNLITIDGGRLAV